MATMKKNSLLSPIIVLVSICLVASFMLAGVYQVTNPIIKLREEETMSNALSAVLPKASSFTLLENVVLEPNVSELYVADNGSGIVCTTNCKSKQGGKIKMMIGIDSLGTITGISVIDHSETAGLGDKALKEDYLQNFYNLNSSDAIASVDAMSGVTKTSNCVKESCQTAIKQYTEYSKSSNPTVEKTVEEKLASARIELFPGIDSFTLMTIDLKDNVQSVYQVANNQGYVIYVNGIYDKEFTASIGIDASGQCSDLKVITLGKVKAESLTQDILSMYKGQSNVDPAVISDTIVSDINAMYVAAYEQYNALK